MTNCKVLAYQQEDPGDNDADYIADPFRFDQLRESVVDGAMLSCFQDNGKNISVYVFNKQIINLSEMVGSLSAFDNRNFEHSWGRPRYNFLYFTTYHPSAQNIDWITGDINSVIQNMKAVGDFVAAAGLTGIFFDSQIQNVSLWRYSLQPSASKYSIAQYQQRVYEIAKEVVTYWLRANPNMQVMMDAGYPQYYDELDLKVAPTNNTFGLWKAWLDGLFDGMGEFFGPIYNNIQSSFGRHRTPELSRKVILSTREGFAIQDGKYDTEYDAAMAKLKGTFDVRYRGSSPYFDAYAQFALGMMVDYTNRYFPTFDNNVPAINYHTPKGVKNLLTKCLYNDYWCWFYAFKHFYFWFSPTLNSEYIDNIREARDEYLMW